MTTRTVALFATLLAAGCGAPLTNDNVEVGTARQALGMYDWNATPAQGLRIGSWNLKRLGQGTKRLDLVAQVIESQFDVMAVQEVMTPAALQSLLTYLPGWSATLSTAVGRNSYYEYYAVLYRTGQTSVTTAYVAADPADEFYREPMVTCLRTNTVDYCLVDIHIVYGTLVGPRDAEIAALGRLVASLRAGSPEKDWIVLGDYNRQASASGFATLNSNGWQFNDDGSVKTTLGTSAYTNPYDHAMIDPVPSREWTGISGRFDTVAAVCGGSFAFCADQVSDHAPIGVLFDASVADDD